MMDDIRAVIETARTRGHEPLDRFIRSRLKDPARGEVEEAREVCIKIIDTLPGLLDRAHREAHERNLGHVFDPVLEHAARYIVSPIDEIPEMTQGLAGLIDDAYLAMCILRDLDRGSESFFGWPLDEPIDFLGELVGSEIRGRLDEIADRALADGEERMVRFWKAIAAEA